MTRITAPPSDPWERNLWARRLPGGPFKAEGYIFSSDQLELLCKSLGRLNVAKAHLFVLRAEMSLRRAPHKLPPLPDGEDEVALAELADRSRLARIALERVLSRHPNAAAWLQKSWETWDPNSPGDAPDCDVRHLFALLGWLESTARAITTRRKKGAQEINDENALATMLLTADYRDTFTSVPKLGSGSPFVRFCGAALPLAGFAPVSLARMKRIVARVAVASETAYVDPIRVVYKPLNRD